MTTGLLFFVLNCNFLSAVTSVLQSSNQWAETSILYLQTLFLNPFSAVMDYNFWAAAPRNFFLNSDFSKQAAGLLGRAVRSYQTLWLQNTAQHMRTFTRML